MLAKYNLSENISKSFRWLLFWLTLYRHPRPKLYTKPIRGWSKI